ncbi:MAG: 2-oxo acid dehydrogenase subunit E2 [Sphingomonadales bacterium]|nr:2-oxo acid dehydrogenase subunit E2 [Sphingomonadales bacterium]MDE2568976.1 2-oxo acid dehydrogenase subunit E2 [Sphingomonadales bacterium]
MSTLRPFCMPKWGIEMTEGTIAEWMVAEGAAFSKGDVLCLIETAKITNEVEAERDGVLSRIVVPAGGEAEPVGALLAIFGDGSEDASALDGFVESFVPAESTGSAGKKTAKKPAAPSPAPAPAKQAIKIDTNRPISPEALKLAETEAVDISGIEGSGRNGRITFQDVQQALRGPASPQLRGPVAVTAEDRSVFASPLARRIAAQNGIALAGVTGTGPRGRISKKDVLALIQAAAPARSAEFILVDNTPVAVPFDTVRKVVARRLTAAKQDIPHFYLRISVAVDALLALRKTANLVLGTKASVNDYIVLASAMALAQHPEVNVQLHGEEVHRFPHADVAVAVASPKGLVTPIVRQANRMRIEQVAGKTRELIDKASAGRLSYEDMDGGTFTVSNLGMFGIEQFDAIINPPQCAILAVGAAVRQAVETGDGDIAFESRIQLTLSVDHRAIDGAAGAGFLATLKSLIEQPEQLFA